MAKKRTYVLSELSDFAEGVKFLCDKSTYSEAKCYEFKPASAGQNGYLTKADWATFNAKQNSLSFGTLSGTANQVSLSGSGAGVLVGGTNIQLSLPQDIAVNSTVQFGQLGLGIAPTEKLHLHSPVSSTGVFQKWTIATTAEAGLKIGLNDYGQAEIRLLQDNLMKVYTNNKLRHVIYSSGDQVFYDTTGLYHFLYLDATNQNVYLKQVGADAVSTLTQRSSGELFFETSNWNGSSETKSKFSIKSYASASANNSNLLSFYYNTAQICDLSGTGQLTITKLVSSLASATNSNLISLINSNSTVGNIASINNYQNTAAKITAAIQFVNTSHNSSTGTADLAFMGCPSGGSLAELSRLTSNGDFGIGITPTSKLHLHSSTAATAVYANWSIATTAPNGLKIGLDTSGNAVINQIENKQFSILTNNSTRLTISAAGTVTIADLAGTGQRIIEASAAGLLTATETIITGKLSDVTAITNLTTGGNWTGVNYTGTAITGTYEGQYYDNGTYYYYAYSDNDWRRVARA